jgi:hypothetical protein
MAHQITWPIPDHVVMVELVGGIMADEVQVVTDKLYASIASAPCERVHLIIDAHEATIADKIWNYSKLRLPHHAKLHLVIVMSDSRLSGLIIAIFSKLVNSRIHYRESVEDCLKTISGVDLAVAEYLGE